MIDFAKLREPFPAADIEWRLQECGKKGDKIWAMCLAYLTNRAIMQRLDDVCGPDNWKNQYTPGPQGGVVCGLSLRCNDEWVTKWDGADNTQVEATKGGLSDAMKRAAVQWGIGRYLYNLDAGFATITDKGEYRGKTKTNEYFKWNPPALPAWALPAGPAPASTPKASPPIPDHDEQRREQAAALGQQEPVISRDAEPIQCISANQAKMLFAKIKATGADEGAFKQHFGVDKIDSLPKAKINEALKFIEAK